MLFLQYNSAFLSNEYHYLIHHYAMSLFGAAGLVSYPALEWHAFSCLTWGGLSCYGEFLTFIATMGDEEVNESLKEALLDAMSGTLSPMADVRKGAEERLKALEVTDGKHFVFVFK